MKITKKFLTTLLFLLTVVGLIISVENIQAETYTGDFVEGEYIESPVFINKRQPNGYTRWQRASTIIQKHTGQIVYCMQPMVELVEGALYNITTEDFAGLQNLSVEQYDRIKLLAYYGYGYGNHTSTDWVSITQLLIWRTTRPDMDIFYSRSAQAQNRDDSIFANEIAELNNLVENHYNRPSFNNTNIEVGYGASFSITDNNNVLSQYKIKNQNNVIASIDGNNLIVNITGIESGEVTFEKTEKRFGQDPIIFYAVDSQNVIKPGDPTPILARITFKINAGKIKLLKVDSQTGNTNPRGDGSLIGAKYGVYDSSGKLVTILTIGEDNTAITDFLEMGTYTIREIEASKGYMLDDTVYTAVVDSSNIVNVTVKENAIEGKIKIIKQDSENKSCKAQGEARLIGAKYDIYNNNKELVDTLTIESDCTATSKYLPYGKYTIKEREAPQGYMLSTKVYNTEIKQNNEIVEVIVEDTIIKGKIKIIKQDSENKSCKAQGEARLIGAKYDIYNNNKELVDTLTIGSDCTATSKYLPYGKYTIKEREAPLGYMLSTKIYNTEIKQNNEIVEVIVDEDIIRGKIKILKFDADDKTQNSKGQASLIGAKYDVYDKNKKLVDTLTIGSDYTATSNYLPYGKYTVKEREAPQGYELDTKTYEVTISTNEEIIRIDSYEKVIENYISILKQYDFVDENTTFLNAESGIIFEIFYPDGKKYGEITTDKNGYATLVIPYGVWKFHQVNTNTGFEKIYDFFVTVDENSEKEQYYNILNNKLSAYLQVLKVDSETGKEIAIANTKFKIYNKDTKQYVSQYVGGKIYDSFQTDEEGKFITYLKLEAGNYKLIEIVSPNGYLINNEGLDFSIGEDTHYNYTTYGAIVTVSFTDRPIKGQIIVNKKGEKIVIKDNNFEYEEIPIEGIKLEIYADEDIKSADGKDLYYAKNNLVDTLFTDKDGYAISEILPLGKYKVIEVQTLDNHVLDSKEYKITLSQQDNKTEIVYETLNIKNYLKKGELDFTKTDLVNGEAIPNTFIEIYNSFNEVIFSGKTDSEGKIIIKNLVVGKYTIKEIEAEKGYVLNKTPIDFEILEDGEVIKAEMKNKPVAGNLEFTKIDISTGTPLPNTLVEIYTESDELVFSGRTDDKGKIIIENLKYGKYYIIEKEAPEGYQINLEKMYFEILEDGEIVKATMEDEQIVEVPDTYAEASYKIEIISLTFLLFGIGGIFYVIKRKNKKQ